MFEFMKGAFYFMCGIGCIYVSVVFATATVKSIKEAARGRKDGQ